MVSYIGDAVPEERQNGSRGGGKEESASGVGVLPKLERILRTREECYAMRGVVHVKLTRG